MCFYGLEEVRFYIGRIRGRWGYTCLLSISDHRLLDFYQGQGRSYLYVKTYLHIHRRSNTHTHTHLCIWDSAKFVMHANSILQIVAFIMPGRSAKIIRYCLTPWIPKLPRSFEIHWVRQYLVNVVIFGIKDLKTSEMTIKPSSNYLVRWPRKYCLNFWHCGGKWKYIECFLK